MLQKETWRGGGKAGETVLVGELSRAAVCMCVQGVNREKPGNLGMQKGPLRGCELQKAVFCPQRETGLYSLTPGFHWVMWGE